MKRESIFFLGLLFFFWLLGAFVFLGDHESELQKGAEATLQTQPGLENVNVKFSGQEAILEGSVRSEADRDAAVDLVRNMKLDSRFNKQHPAVTRVVYKNLEVKEAPYIEPPIEDSFTTGAPGSFTRVEPSVVGGFDPAAFDPTGVSAPPAIPPPPAPAPELVVPKKPAYLTMTAYGDTVNIHGQVADAATRGKVMASAFETYGGTLGVDYNLADLVIDPDVESIPNPSRTLETFPDIPENGVVAATRLGDAWHRIDGAEDNMVMLSSIEAQYPEHPMRESILTDLRDWQRNRTTSEPAFGSALPVPTEPPLDLGIAITPPPTFEETTTPAPLPEIIGQRADFDWAEKLLSNPIKFKKGAANGSSITTIQAHRMVSAVRKRIPNARFKIIGHTCTDGDAAANQKLSEKRATSIRDYLAAKGIPADIFSIEGRGEGEPIANNGTESGKQRNRRVEIELTNNPF